jgi:serine/threonine protein kinase
LIGTLGYLAPEQLSGRAPVSHRADVHALAIVAYEALTGADAFVEREPARFLREVTEEYPIAPSQLVAASGAVDEVFRVALAKDPGDRFDDAPAFAIALRAAFAGGIDQRLREDARRLGARATWRSPKDPAPPRIGRETEDETLAAVTARASLADAATDARPHWSGVHRRTKPSPSRDATLQGESCEGSFDRTGITLAAATEELIRSVV